MPDDLRTCAGSPPMALDGASERDAKDLPLRDDIRLLGRILGDTVREQRGAAAFDTLERIRQSSIRFRRDADRVAREELEHTLNALPRSEALHIIRAFGFFSHLANIAEDQHHIRRNRAHAFAPSAPREGTMARALERLRDAHISPDRLRQFFAEAMVVPVLTAHPTEVRRKSMIDREMEVAELLAERDLRELTEGELAANETALRRAILTLWQTNLLRRTRLQVADEVNNSLAYYDYTFLTELPRFYADLETHTAAALGDALKSQSSKALSHYLAELRLLGAELSLDSRLVEVSPSLNELAARSPDRSPYRRYEPYRRAITGIYARLAATARALDQADPLLAPVGSAAPYADCGELLAELTTVANSLIANGSELLAKGRLRDLRRAVDVFGFHLAAIDLRQNSVVHERVVGELLEVAQPGTDYLALTEDQRVALLLAELATARPLASP